MKLMKKFSDFVLRTKSRTFGAILKTYNGVTQWVSAKFPVFAEEGYKKNVYVYSAIRAVSKSVSSVSWGLYKKPTTPQEDLKKVFSHPILNLMNRPNPYESGLTFRLNLMTYLMIYGNCYVEVISPQGKAPKEMYLLRPDRVSINPNTTPGGGLVKSYLYKVNGHERTIPANKILHLKYMDPLNDFYGLSPIVPGGMAIDQNNLSKTWNIDVLNNGGMPSGALSTEESLTEEQFESISEQLREYNGNKKGNAIVLEAGLKYQRFSMSSEDMSWIHTTKMSAREISIVFGVPPEILGDSTNKTYNNYTQARKAFYEETVIPTLEMLKEELGYWLIKKFEDSGSSDLSSDKYVLTYNTEDIEAIQEDINIKWDKANQSYFLTLNEKRNLVGYDDVDNGEVYLVPNTMTIIDTLETAEETPQEAVEDVASTEPVSTDERTDST